MQFSWCKSIQKGLLTLVLIGAGALSQAEQSLDNDTLDDWLATTQDLMPMQEVFESMGKNSSIAEQYTEEEFKALDIDKQDNLLDEALKEQGAYDQVYAVLNEYDWSSAGEYMRASSRLGMAIAAHMREQMAKNLPPEQRKMMEEMSGQVNANPDDVALVAENWDKVSSFVQQHMGQQQMPTGQ